MADTLVVNADSDSLWTAVADLVPAAQSERRYWRLQRREIVIRPVLIKRTVGLGTEILEQDVEGEFLLDA